MQREREIIESLAAERAIGLEELKLLLTTEDEESLCFLAEKAGETARAVYGNRVYIRGLIEFTNCCQNDCYYCGIRRSSPASRYRLTQEEIFSCCRHGYALGFRTFVLQGGEDGRNTDKEICDLVAGIRERYPDCAITLSIGEKPKESYKAYFDAGADRYLLRHETADRAHYRSLHPPAMSFENRVRCLYDLKEIGFQTGCGFMVGSPGQTAETIYADLQFIRSFAPEMVGIGPFIPHQDTPFRDRPAGTLSRTLRLLSIIRLLSPHVLLPATTALGTIHPEGRERGILAGANVVMPNLSPEEVRGKYSLYDNKLCTGGEAAEGLAALKKRFSEIGYEIAVTRGDFIKN